MQKALVNPSGLCFSATAGTGGTSSCAPLLCSAITIREYESYSLLLRQNTLHKNVTVHVPVAGHRYRNHLLRLLRRFLNRKPPDVSSYCRSSVVIAHLVVRFTTYHVWRVIQVEQGVSVLERKCSFRGGGGGGILAVPSPFIYRKYKYFFNYSVIVF